jgi:hypothetical protein
VDLRGARWGGHPYKQLLVGGGEGHAVSGGVRKFCKFMVLVDGDGIRVRNRRFSVSKRHTSQQLDRSG